LGLGTGDAWPPVARPRVQHHPPHLRAGSSRKPSRRSRPCSRRPSSPGSSSRADQEGRVAIDGALPMRSFQIRLVGCHLMVLCQAQEGEVKGFMRMGIMLHPMASAFSTPIILMYLILAILWRRYVGRDFWCGSRFFWRNQTENRYFNFLRVLNR